MVKELCVHKLGSRINGLENVIPTVGCLIALIMNTAYQLQEPKSNMNFKKASTYGDGILHSVV